MPKSISVKLSKSPRKDNKSPKLLKWDLKEHQSLNFDLNTREHFIQRFRNPPNWHYTRSFVSKRKNSKAKFFNWRNKSPCKSLKEQKVQQMSTSFDLYSDASCNKFKF